LVAKEFNQLPAQAAAVTGIFLVIKSMSASLMKHDVLVGGFNHLEKYEFVNGKDYPIYYGK